MVMGDVMIIMLEDEIGDVLDGAELWIDCSMEQLKTIRVANVHKTCDGEVVLRLQMKESLGCGDEK